MDFLALVVVYNQSCENSITCQGLFACPSNVKIIVYDNSTQDYGNREYCIENGWIYLGGTGNVGLSKAYNSVIDSVISQYSDAMLCLFDDDSHVSEEYFIRLQETVQQHPKRSIFVPILLLEDGKVLSPHVQNPKTGAVQLFNSISDIESYKGWFLGALNSGMAIRLEVFRDYRYDEGLFLDCVDDKFIMDMRTRNQVPVVFRYQFVHQLSSYTKSPLTSALLRFSIFARDLKYCYRDNRYIYYRLILRRTLRLSFEYKSLQFIKVICKLK